MNDHLLKKYLATVTNGMKDDYDCILSKVTEDPGTAGDQGEENWCQLFKHWLPPIFQIVTKGQIIGVDGTTTPQIDVLILRPEYPEKLKEKKYYLASGVVAAFECKITLKSRHFAKFFRNSVKISQICGPQAGSLYRELHSPVIYGLLAHSHEWNKPKSKPFNNFQSNLIRADAKQITHPNQMPGVICVSDLLTAISCKGVNLADYGNEKSFTSNYFCCPDSNQKDNHGSTPIGTLLTSLLHKLAWEYPNIKTLAGYFRSSGVGATGSGEIRFWDKNIVSDDVKKSIMQGKLNGNVWDEWCWGFL